MPASQHRLISDALARPDEAVACEDELVVLRRFRRAAQAKVSRRGFMIQPTSATNEHYGEFSLSRRGNASRYRGGFIHSSTPQHILWMESR